MPERYERVRADILAYLRAAPGPVPAATVLRDLEGRGIDPALVSLLLSDLVNHRRIALDSQRRLQLTPAVVA